MKIFCSLILILSFFLTGHAQEKQNKPENESLTKEKQNQRYDLFKHSPKFRFPNPDGLVFSDSIRHLPGQMHMGPLSGNHLYAQSAMPVAKPSPEFSSNMPVMVPDSSVHYFILQKQIKMIRPFEELKK